MTKTIFHTVCALLLSTSFTHAQTIFNDGQTHNVNSSIGPVETLHGTTVNFNQGASITGGFALNPQTIGYTTSIYSDTTSTITLNGGSVYAPVALGSPAGNISGIAIYADGTFNGFHGSAQGGAGANYQDGGWGLDAHGNVNVTGGSYQGGAGGLGANGGTAAYMENLTTGIVTSVNINGGTFTGGSSATAEGGAGLVVSTNGTAIITGGTFTGGNGIDGTADSLVFAGGGQSQMNILGGEFRGAVEATLNGNDSLNFLGLSSFTVEKLPQYEQWQVTGILQNGTPLNIDLVTNANNYFETTPLTGVVELSFNTVSAVPEPKSWILLLVGIVGVANHAKWTCAQLGRLVKGETPST
jgi:hypothetical protein